jgi:hypothetical protein
MTDKKPPFELNEKLLHKLQLERIHGIDAETEAVRELLTLIPMAGEVMTLLRKAGATPRQSAWYCVSQTLSLAPRAMRISSERAACFWRSRTNEELAILDALSRTVLDRRWSRLHGSRNLPAGAMDHVEAGPGWIHQDQGRRRALGAPTMDEYRQLTERQLVDRAIAMLAEIERRLGRDLPKEQWRDQPVSRIIETLLEFGRQFPDERSPR